MKPFIVRMPFGKYVGRPLESVKSDYLRWLLGRDIDDRLRDEAERVLRMRHGFLAHIPDAPAKESGAAK